MKNIKKNEYREFCLNEKNIPIFSKDWWLDSVCGTDNWDVALVKKNKQIVGSLPYYKKKKFTFQLISMPNLTQQLGPYFVYPKNQKYNQKLSFEKQIINELISQLPRFDYFNQSLHYSIENWLPFYWLGYDSTTYYSYIIDDLTNLDNVFNNLTSSYRNKIKKAQKIVKIKKGLSVEDFYEINRMTFERQNIKIPYSLEFFKKHDNYLSKHKSREIFYAVDDTNQVHSALYLTWDSNSSYVHIVGENPDLRNSGAGILAIWEAIKFTKNELLLNNFDFEGSVIEQVERVRRGFGAKQKPYFNINICKSFLLKIILHLKIILSRQ
jgi:lipid II:glycine glycyltransferase (peptidoglycan interpeptide bridge formation enzyme)